MVWTWRVVIAGTAVGLALHPASARAEPHRVCLYLDIGDLYWDASPRASDGRDFREEYGRNEGPTSYPAQRWLARVSDETTGEVFFGWDPLDDSGCATFELAGDTDLLVEWARWAVWSETGNQVVGYHCDTATSDCHLQRYRTTVPTGTGATNVVVEPTSTKEVDTILWAATYAEERFASLGEQPLEGARVYVSYDPAMLLPGATQADRTFGGQPSAIFKGDAWHSKFTVSHELGHLQTMTALQPAFSRSDLDYCYATPADCRGNHTMRSHEWQAAAAIEGIASWYAVSVWNDVDIVDCPRVCHVGVRYVEPGAGDAANDYVVPLENPVCTERDAVPCAPGVGNEWDWLSAFRLFRLGAPTVPSFRVMFTMLSAAYANGGWTKNAPSDAFWANLDQTMAAHLGNDHGAWRAAAAQMELDR
jgi:hypothetical protein